MDFKKLLNKKNLLLAGASLALMIASSVIDGMKEEQAMEEMKRDILIELKEESKK